MVLGSRMTHRAAKNIVAAMPKYERMHLESMNRRKLTAPTVSRIMGKLSLGIEYRTGVVSSLVSWNVLLCKIAVSV